MPSGTPSIGTTLHTLQSVTKSVVSLTLGIAIARGELPSLDTPVLSFFDASAVANVDDLKRRMTLRHLLNMSTGLEWDERLPYSDPANTFTIMAKSLDWVRYTLDAPMTSEPGTVFNYNSGATLVLGHIFRVATGIDIEEYALRHLLEPLGIEDYYWDRTPSGLADAQEGCTCPPEISRGSCCWCTKGAVGRAGNSSRRLGCRNRSLSSSPPRQKAMRPSACRGGRSRISTGASLGGHCLGKGLEVSDRLFCLT